MDQKVVWEFDLENLLRQRENPARDFEAVQSGPKFGLFATRKDA